MVRVPKIWAGLDAEQKKGSFCRSLLGSRLFAALNRTGCLRRSELWGRLRSLQAAFYFGPNQATPRAACLQPVPRTFPLLNGGKLTRFDSATWRRIVKGIPGNEVVNAVREDPQRKGRLFAGTERAVHVSFNDGDDWRPLRLNRPATSIRDLVVHKDDIVVALPAGRARTAAASGLSTASRRCANSTPKLRRLNAPAARTAEPPRTLYKNITSLSSPPGEAAPLRLPASRRSGSSRRKTRP